MLIDHASYSGLNEAVAQRVLREMWFAMSRRREVAIKPGMGLSAKELGDFASAFEHEQMDRAKTLI